MFSNGILPTLTSPEKDDHAFQAYLIMKNRY